MISKPAFLLPLVIFMGMAGFVLGQNSAPPVFENSSGVRLYCANPIAVAPSMTIENVQVNEDTEGIKISISNYIKGQDVLEYEKVGSFRYKWDTNTGTLEITGVGSDQAYEEAARKVYYRNLSSNPTGGIRSFSISLRDADYLPLTADSGHFYRYIPQLDVTWKEARDLAANDDYYGLKGYLATITSSAENDFIWTKIDGVGWIGASDEAEEGKWMWVTGPEAGTHFWQGNYPNGSSVNNSYSFWNSGEPNNQGDEDYAHINSNPGTIQKSWNDLPNAGGGPSSQYYRAQGYVVEYGGTPNDPVLKLSATAFVDVKDNIYPQLDYNQVDTFICGQLSQLYKIAFTNGHPDILLSPLDSRVTVTNQDTYAPTITVPEFGIYLFQLNMIAESGCEYTDTIRVGFHNQPEAKFELDETSCGGYNLQLSFQGTTVEEALFTWYYNGEEYASETDLTELEIPLGFQLKDRSVGLKVNELGCVDSSAVPVTVAPKNTVEVEDSLGCSPHSIQLRATAVETTESYAWNFGDGTGSLEQKPVHAFVNTSDTVRRFDVDLTVIANNGCRNYEMMEELITTYPVPRAAFDAVPEVVLITSPGISFYNNSEAADSYLWDFGDTTLVSEEENPIHKYNDIGDFNVRLEAVNDFGCRDTAEHIVGIDFDRFFPPNAFSPNAILAEDREFRIYGKGIVEEGYQLMVYNRWGEMIFESNSSSVGWDGKMSNGNDAPAGVYTWLLHYVDVKSEKHTQQGNVTLLY
ncbi:PKD domain-containing protein [Maribellus sp. YY47]|uniref:PKD domain-containing protein n=1 Tax=Maribellus sp. YY47 TaxID=2929486 RepID=UPI0020008DAD|nr:PKD domain-containing protein [Maribellus sp. YY47]MCK3683365.1 PKD domain-containing protein [Maribellus sp. YY47]